jgi:hypothetical protein
MEVSIFPTREVRRELERFVEIRLHTDTHREFSEVQRKLTGSVQNPDYVIVDPDAPDTPVSIFRGSLAPGRTDFQEWLKTQ